MATAEHVLVSEHESVWQNLNLKKVHREALCTVTNIGINIKALPGKKNEKCLYLLF